MSKSSGFLENCLSFAHGYPALPPPWPLSGTCWPTTTATYACLPVGLSTVANKHMYGVLQKRPTCRKDGTPGTSVGHHLYAVLEEQEEFWEAQPGASTMRDIPRPVRTVISEEGASFDSYAVMIKVIANKALLTVRKYKSGTAGRLAAQLRIFDPRQKRGW